jgi:hypothetical protein
MSGNSTLRSNACLLVQLLSWYKNTSLLGVTVQRAWHASLLWAGLRSLEKGVCAAALLLLLLLQMQLCVLRLQLSVQFQSWILMQPSVIPLNRQHAQERERERARCSTAFSASVFVLLY